MHAKLAYVSAAANRHSKIASVSSDGNLIAYGSNKFIALWDLKDDHGVVDTIPGHSGNITCVRFMQNCNDSLLSGDDQGWLYLHQKRENGWQVISKVRAHRHGVSTLVEFDGIIATGSSDATLKIWTYSLEESSTSQGTEKNSVDAQKDFREVQTIRTGKRFPLCTEIAQLPGTSGYILAVGSTDRFLRIYVRSQKQQFSEALTLSGHEDWVKSLAFASLPGSGDPILTLASGSQDGTIRLWTIVPAGSLDNVKEPATSNATELGDDLLDAFEASLGEVAGDDGGRQISLKQHLIKIKDGTETSHFTLTFDALMIGHDAGITSVAWNPLVTPPVLLSTSVDSSVILWSPTTIGGATDESSKLWTNHHRFGDVGGQRLGGFVGGTWLGSSELCAWGWNGGFRRWGHLETEGEEFQAITGHADGVHGISWNASGEYFITASLDQTVRVHASNSLSSQKRWSEFARSQIHGYDCLKAAFLSDFRYASISDEKTTRIFDAPGGFLTLLTTLGVKQVEDADSHRPVAASVPPLGLSNKASGSKDVYPVERNYSRPPFEAELASTTLWPEIEKIYGHGYESIALTVSNSKTLIATACKSTSAEHAVIRLVDTERFKPFGNPLEGHTLTVTNIAFNKNDKLILTVSKDRTWRLFERIDDQSGYRPLAIDKSHSRIIWDCAWMHEEDIFATASRDKTVRVWHARVEENKGKPLLATIKLTQAATAVNFRPRDANGRVLMAVGLENGEILIFAAQSPSYETWTMQLKLPSNMSHVDHVYAVAWRPSEQCSLATCSDDGSVRLIEFIE